MKMKDRICVGSRESRLAVIQSRIVMEYIQRNNPGMQVDLLTMKTTGDKILDRTLDQVGGKGLFVKELDKALLEGRSDLSVHSLKDMPMELPQELPILAFSKREDPRDVLVLPEGREKMDESLPIGCSSRRRVLQLQELFPDRRFEPVRGNLQTRLRKLEEGKYGALILAAAGLKRLGLEQRIHRYFTVDEVIPAAGQGTLAVQGRAGEDVSFLAGFEDAANRIASLCERAFVRELDGGCSSPVAAYAQVQGEEILLRGLRVDTLVLVGGLTDTCIHYTAVDAHRWDYRIRVVTDAVAGSDPEAHTASLRAIRYLQRDALVTAADVEAAE